MVRWLALIAILSTYVVGIVWLVTAVWFAARRRGTLRQKMWQFLRTLLPEPWMLLAIVALAVALHFVPRDAWNPLTLRPPVLQALGAILIAASCALMVWARLVLGDMWAARPMVQEHHELRTGGPYRLVRHPIYTGMIGGTLGLLLLAGFRSVIPVFLLVLGWLLWRVHVEDGMMVATFGDRYRDYQAHVRALVPLPRRSSRTEAPHPTA